MLSRLEEEGRGEEAVHHLALHLPTHYLRFSTMKGRPQLLAQFALSIPRAGLCLYASLQKRAKTKFFTALSPSSPTRTLSFDFVFAQMTLSYISFILLR